MDTQNTKSVLNLAWFQFSTGTHHDKKVIWIKACNSCANKKAACLILLQAADSLCAPCWT